MKKLYYYLVSMLVAAVVAVGCTEDITTDEIRPEEGNGGVVKTEFIEVTALMEAEESRTTLIDGGEGGVATWSEGDAIGAVSADGIITECVVKSIDGANATFSVPADTKYAVYPHQSGDSFNTETDLLTHALGATITLDGSKQVFGNKQNTMCAHLSNKSLSFKHLCGFIEVKLKGTGVVKHVALRNNTKTWDALSGEGTIDFSDANEPKFTSGTDHGKTFNWVYATCSDVQLSASEATSFYFVVPPRTYENLAICVQTDKGSYSVLSKSAIEVNRAMIRPLAAIDVDKIASNATTDLSADGVANCYVVPQGGAAKFYSFPARKINGEANLENVAYAHLMWSEGEQLVNNVSYNASNGKVSFKYQGSNAEGNATIGVFNSNNVLLWAWHIWCTDQPNMIRVTNAAGTKVYGILDRNIGATYTPATPAEATSISETDATAALGLYYQYGRPTPFPRGTSIKTNAESTAFKSNSNFAVQYGFRSYAQDFRMTTTRNNYANALRYPNLFFVVRYTDKEGTTDATSGNSFHTWYQTPYHAYSQSTYLWYSTNSNQTTVVDKKADNDPCPAGYSVEEGMAPAFGYLRSKESNLYTKVTYSSSYSYGYYWKCPNAGGLVWLPASGFRNENGKLSYVGQNYNLWAVPTYTDKNGTLAVYRLYGLNSKTSDTENYTNANVYANYYQHAQGFNVRCRLMDITDLQGAASVTSFEGQGTAASPYLIKTSADLVKLSNLCNGSAMASGTTEFTKAHYALAATINMNNVAFTPINNFSGSFDGKNYTIQNLTVTPNSDNSPTGMFSEITGATIKNLKFTDALVNVTSTSQLCTGGLVGVATNSTIDNITFAGKVSSAAAATYTGTLEGRNVSAVVGGVVGVSVNSTISNITRTGNVRSTAGQYVGGIVAIVDGGSVTKAKFAKGANLYTTMNHVGGIAALMGNDAIISECTVEAPVMSTNAYIGGIVGRMQSGTVSKCLVSSNATVAGHQDNATNNSYLGTGGIVGILQTVDGKGATAVIEKCACYTDVSSNAYVGGLIGDLIGNNSAISVRVSDCVFKGSITTAYMNKNLYGLAGGLIGCCHQSVSMGGVTKVTDCVALVDNINFNTVATAAGYGGITGYVKSTEFLRCYTNLDLGTVVSQDGKTIAEYSISNYGTFYGVGNGVSNGVSLKNCYHLTGKIGQGDVASKTNVEALSISQMTDGTLLGKLNGAGGSWAAGDNGFPVPTAVPANTVNLATLAKTRVSVIGDSISTFSGYMPTGYNTFYPKGTVTSASQTYWYKLIYNKMSNATLDMNIAWTGSVVARSTDANYLATDHTAGHCFVERFRDDGMGNPDVILLHGGTNDCSNRGKSIALYPGYPTYGGTGYDSSACPTEAQIKTMCDNAAALTTRAAIEKLNDTTFVEAYIKLICMMHHRYPKAKVVMIIGDRIHAGTRLAIQRIANNYASKWGYRCVNLQDAACGTISKIENDNTHPNEAGHETMAKYIYTKVGSYID